MKINYLRLIIRTDCNVLVVGSLGEAGLHESGTA